MVREEEEAAALRYFLSNCRQVLLKSKRSTWLERCRHQQSTPDQASALRKACLLLMTRLSQNPNDHGLRATLASNLESLHTSSSFANLGAMAEQLSGVDIDEESLIKSMETRLFGDGQRNDVFTRQFESVLSRMKARDEQKTMESVKENTPKPDSNKPYSTDAFTTAKKMIDPGQLKAAQRKNLGGKRWANTKEDGADELNEVKTEFGYYNLTKAPVLKNQSSNNQLKRQLSDLNVNQQPQAQSAKEEPIDERLQGIEPRLIELIRNEIMTKVDSITWERIAGLEHAKKTIFEIVIWPMLRPYQYCIPLYII